MKWQRSVNQPHIIAADEIRCIILTHLHKSAVYFRAVRVMEMEVFYGWSDTVAGFWLKSIDDGTLKHTHRANNWRYIRVQI